MTYVDNGPAWWTLLLLAIGGGLIALLARDGAKELAGWWAGWRRQYKARHRADPIENATDDAPDTEFLDPPSGATPREGVSGPGSWPLNRRAPAAQTQVPVAPPSSNTPSTEPRLGARASLPPSYALGSFNRITTPESWGSTPLRWAANGRYVHRADCTHMTTGTAITVWSEDAARNWADSMSPRLTGCPHCDPFNAPEPQPARETS